MSDATLEDGFALRPVEAAEVQAVFRATRGLERDRRLLRLVSVGGGWAIAVMMTAVAAASLGVMWHRPVPRDRVVVAVQHDDGSWEPAVDRDDLPATRKALLFRNTVIQYVAARESYTWEAVNANYRRVSAMSSADERSRYQAVMRDKHNPDSPSALYGDGQKAAVAEIDLSHMTIFSDPAAPNAVTVQFIVHVYGSNIQPRDEKFIRKTAQMTWGQANDGELPMWVQQSYDPAGIVFTHYESHPDPDAR